MLLPVIGVSIVAALVTSLVSLKKVKENQFFSDVPKPLLAVGIYVWGDGVIVGPFWLVAALLWLFLDFNFVAIGQFYLLFLIIRSAYEVVYWINHQMHQRQYIPPLFRNVSWLNAEQHGILYQLLHTCLIVLAAGLLWFSLV